MNEPILNISGLCAGYGDRPAVADVSFTLHPGEILCIVGESGCGKSTLLKALIGAPEVRLLSGAIELDGDTVSELSEKARRRACSARMGMVFQSPGASFNPIRSYRKQFIETLKSHGKYDPATFERHAAEAFARVELPDWRRILRECPYALSGGMNQRAAIALALLLEQDILLCDEPTSALDVNSQAQILRLLAELCHERGTSAVLVSHDLSVVACLCDRVLVMRDGAVVEQGPTRQIIDAPREDYTRALVDSVMEI